MALTIERVLAWEALDSRGTPTVACVVTLAGGAEGEAIVPSGHRLERTRRTSSETAPIASPARARSPLWRT